MSEQHSYWMHLDDNRTSNINICLHCDRLFRTKHNTLLILLSSSGRELLPIAGNLLRLSASSSPKSTALNSRPFIPLRVSYSVAPLLYSIGCDDRELSVLITESLWVPKNRVVFCWWALRCCCKYFRATSVVFGFQQSRLSQELLLVKDPPFWMMQRE